MCESSKIVPTRTVNCLRQALHFQTPLRTGDFESAFPVSLYAAPVDLQCGQTTPFGQRRDSKNSRASSSLLKYLARFARLRVVSFIATSPLSRCCNDNKLAWVCQRYNSLKKNPTAKPARPAPAIASQLRFTFAQSCGLDAVARSSNSPCAPWSPGTGSQRLSG